MISIDYDKISEIAEILKSINIPVDNFTNPTFFPPIHYSEEEVSRFFLFIVAVDHRTGTYDDPFEGYVDGMYLKGSDLLYHLAVKRFLENTDYFSPDQLINITTRDISEWFSVNKPRRKVVSDPSTRAHLIRDIASKLIKIYEGKVMNIINLSGGYLYKSNGTGFIDQLKAFIAYSDPVEKKPLLLAKFLERRGIIKVKDQENINVPVDNHLMRIAVRLGIVKPTETILKYFKFWDEEVDRELDILFRLVARRAYSRLATKASISPFLLDDFLWKLGRERCKFNSPLCKENDSDTVKNDCPFIETCEQYVKRKTIILNEHKFMKTLYY